MVAAAAMVVLFLIIAAVVLNVGWWLRDKRDAQNDVDAAVLAGAQELPDESAASAVADAWADNNGVASGDLNCCVFEDLTGDGAADLIRATVAREPGSLAGSLLDGGIVTVTAKAAAAKQRAVAACVAPWAVDGDQESGPPLDPDGYWGLQPQELFVFHTSEFVVPGNFGALALYGNGAVDYKEAITYACGSGDQGVCDQDDPQVPEWGTLVCDVKTGNMGQNTDDALTDRYGEGTNCNAATYLQAESLFTNDPSCGDRALLIPIIDTFPPGGHGAINILGLATFYVADWDRRPPYGDEDLNSDTMADDAMVWGYFLQDVGVSPAWEIRWGYSDNPFAPIKIVLVE